MSESSLGTSSGNPAGRPVSTNITSLHFEEHHDIGFYASELCITTTYLSRVVRQVSGSEHIAEALTADYVLGIWAKFLAETCDIDIHGTVGDDDSSPDCVHELLTG